MFEKLMMFTIVLGALSAVAEKPLRQAQDKPNLIVIFADDMGVTDVGAFHALYPGAPEAQLPPFTLDVTDALKTGANKIAVRVTSTTEGKPQMGETVQLKTVTREAVK